MVEKMNKGIDTPISIPSQENTNLKTSLGYARLLGWCVFPLHTIIHGKCTCNNLNCKDKGKHPATKNGFKDATIDERKIIEWWTERPYLNIGIKTGKRSGIFVLDIDTKVHSDTGMTGIESLKELENKHGILPNTPIQITGSGGLHYVFKYIEGIRNKGNIFPSIDVRGDGGYIVASPSIHESGDSYIWELSSRPSEIAIAEPPNWLVDKLLNKDTKGQYKLKPTNEYIRILQGVEDGERNNALVTLIGHLLARNIDYREAFEIVHIWNESRVNPPLDSDSVTIAFNNILQREAESR